MPRKKYYEQGHNQGFFLKDQDQNLSVKDQDKDMYLSSRDQHQDFKFVLKDSLRTRTRTRTTTLAVGMLKLTTDRHEASRCLFATA